MPPSPSYSSSGALLRSNISHLYGDVFWWGSLGGSLLGPQFASWLGLRPALWLSAALRVLGGVLFMAWG